MTYNIASNANAYTDAIYEHLDDVVLDRNECERARSIIKSWPFYKPTTLTRIADDELVGHVFAKAESERAPLKSFKMLGAVYAAALTVCERSTDEVAPSDIFQMEDLSTEQRQQRAKLKLVSATTGNHGTALAWAAEQLGCACTIYLPKSASKSRQERIENYGATTVRVAGSYDDAVELAYNDATKNDWIVIQDTAVATLDNHCTNIMNGYTTVIDEACNQMAPGRPTHVFVQVGVGGLAASVACYLWHRFGSQRPMIIGVESLAAACLFESIKRGEPVSVKGPHNTMMGGVASGELSMVAWPILKHLVDFVVTIDDISACGTLRRLAECGSEEDPLEIGVTGVAGLAALQAVSSDSGMLDILGLQSDSEVLCFVTEGITDAESYERFVALSDK